MNHSSRGSAQEGRAILMIVDAHAHVFVKTSDKYPRSLSDLYPAEREAPAEDLLAAMRANRVTYAILVHIAGQDKYLLDCLRRYPDNFRGIITPQSGEELTELAFTGRTSPVVGFRFLTLGDANARAVESMPTFRLLQQIATAGLCVSFYGDDAQLRLLKRILDKLPDLVILVNHLGMPRSDLVVDNLGRPRPRAVSPPAVSPSFLELSRHPTAHVIMSGQYAFSQEAYPYMDMRPVVAAILDAFGPGRLLFGSDFPWIAQHPGYGKVVSLLERQFPGLSARERSAIIGGNAARLFDLG